MDWADEHKSRRLQLPTEPKVSQLVEVVRKTSDGYDSRTSETFYKYEKLGVYSSKQAALEAIISKYLPDISIQPLQIDG
jgi:hypothetical protein